MIKREIDGTLSYTDQNGTLISANIFDHSGLYERLIATESDQGDCERANAEKLNDYTEKLHNAQLNMDIGRPIPAPAKPLMRVVSDRDVITYTDWVPPLPELKVRVEDHTGEGRIAVDTVDKQELLLRMVTALFNQAFPKAK